MIPNRSPLPGELIASLEQSESAEFSERTASLAAIALTVMKQRTDITVTTTRQCGSTKHGRRTPRVGLCDRRDHRRLRRGSSHGIRRTLTAGTCATEALQVLLDLRPAC